MEWIMWHGIHVIFWLFGRRTHTFTALAEGCGEWHRELFGYTLIIDVSLYNKEYALFRGEQPIAQVIF